MKTLLFLQLSPEFGGTKFGPFNGSEVRLGSDPGQNDIHLPESLGVLPEHVKLLLQKSDSFVLTPIERTATVFIWRDDGRPPKQITTPMALGPGDGFSLVSEDGPKFFIVCERPKPKKRDDPKTSLGQNLKSINGAGIFQEIKRIGLARAMTSSFGYYFRNLNTMIMSGQIFSPRYIVMFLMIASGWLMAGTAGCGALFMQHSISGLSEENADLKGELDACGVADDDPSIANLTGKILNDRSWEDSLAFDDLRKAYIDELHVVFDRKDRYRWVWNKKTSGSFQSMARVLENSKAIPKAVSRVFLYTAAIENGGAKDTPFKLIKQNASGEEVCGRGPIYLSYRQAKNLNLDSVQPDALVAASLATSDDTEEKQKLLEITLGDDIVDWEWDAQEIGAASTGRQGAGQCIFTTGDDDREDTRALHTALRKVLGKKAKKVPNVGRDNWISARLMRFYASDLKSDYNRIAFRSGKSIKSGLADASDTERAFIVNQTGRLMARSVAIPCLAKLDLKKKDAPKYLKSSMPSIYRCGVLDMMIKMED